MKTVEEIQKELDKKTLEIQELKRTLEEAKKINRFTSIGSSVYTLCADGSAHAIIYKDDLYDRKTVDQGSLFRTREEAEEERDRRALLAKARKLGAKYGKSPYKRWVIRSCNVSGLYISPMTCPGMGEVYFPSRESVQKFLHENYDEILRLFF